MDIDTNTKKAPPGSEKIDSEKIRLNDELAKQKRWLTYLKIAACLTYALHFAIALISDSFSLYDTAIAISLAISLALTDADIDVVFIGALALAAFAITLISDYLFVNEAAPTFTFAIAIAIAFAFAGDVLDTVFIGALALAALAAAYAVDDSTFPGAGAGAVGAGLFLLIRINAAINDYRIDLMRLDLVSNVSGI